MSELHISEIRDSHRWKKREFFKSGSSLRNDVAYQTSLSSDIQLFSSLSLLKGWGGGALGYTCVSVVVVHNIRKASSWSS